jgi:hypothetical protein
MTSSKQTNTKLPSQEQSHPPKDAEKADVGERDRMGEDDEESEHSSPPKR